MKQNYIIEFSKIYKRLMDIELKLKERFIHSLNCAFGEKLIYRLTPYLNSLSKTDKYNYTKIINGNFQIHNSIKEILESKKNNEQKIQKLMETLYLKDVLDLLTSYKMVYKNTYFKKSFYCLKPEFNDIKKYSSKLYKLRNVIMHFNFKEFEKNRKEYIETLRFWEMQLSCFDSFIHEFPSVKPTVNNILKLIFCRYPEVFNGYDRILCDVFDDIAILNGLPANKLPQYWSIVRQKFAMSKTCQSTDTNQIEQKKIDFNIE